MAAEGRRVTVTDEPTLITSAAADGVAGQFFILRPVGGAVDIGGPDVEFGSGFAVADGAAVDSSIFGGDLVYAVADSGTVTVHVFETGV